MESMRVLGKTEFGEALSSPLVGEDKGGGSRHASIALSLMAAGAGRGRPRATIKLSMVGATPYPCPPPQGGRGSLPRATQV